MTDTALDRTTTAQPNQTGTAIQRMAPDDWAMVKEQSAALEAAGKGTGILPKGISNRYQISAIVMKGWELGLSPMYALEQIGLVNGKPVVQGQALLAIIQRRHGRKAVQILETTDERCTVRFQEPGVEPLDITWTAQDAKKAGLLDKSGPWKQYTRTMLRWRAIAEGARIYFADTVAGLYLPDEMGLAATIDTTGNLVIDGDPKIVEAPARHITEHGEIIDHEPAPADTSDDADDDPTELTLRDRAAMHIAEVADLTGLAHESILAQIRRSEKLRAIEWDRLSDEELETIDQAALTLLREAEADAHQRAFDMPETAWR